MSALEETTELIRAANVGEDVDSHAFLNNVEDTTALVGCILYATAVAAAACYSSMFIVLFLWFIAAFS
uniref:Uncharacterized protein n=1 Tax=Glossina palpalis gambiensis TaxID=67801 RepID=A0A1B0BME0_9MUSC